MSDGMGRADRSHRSSQFRTNPEEPGVVVPLELSPDVMVWYDAKTDIFTIEMNAKKNNNDRKYRYIIKDILPESRKALLKFLVLIEKGMLTEDTVSQPPSTLSKKPPEIQAQPTYQMCA
jgi:hypothetical protein